MDITNFQYFKTEKTENIMLYIVGVKILKVCIKLLLYLLIQT